MTRLLPLLAIMALFLGLVSVVHAQATTVSFDSATYTREIDENTGADQDVGSPVTASDTQSDALTYTLGGADAASFEIVSTSGQIQTKTGVTYDHEAKSTYTVTVTASDGKGGTATATVTITVNDVNEPPLAPDQPIAVAVPRTYHQISVRWFPPENSGRPEITGYDVQYEDYDPEISGFVWLDGPQDVHGTSAIITNLFHSATYTVRVRAKNDEGDGPWSPGETSSTHFPPYEFELGDVRIPSGLGPGDSFRLLFVTRIVRSDDQGDFFLATNDRIHDYTNLIIFPAGGSPYFPASFSLTLLPLVSIPHVDARVATNTTWTDSDRGVPIYWVGGSKVADDYADFYDGDWDDETNVRDSRGRLHTVPPVVWTGSAHDGTELMVNGVSHALGQPQAGYGTPGSNTPGAGPLYSGSTADSTVLHSLYGLTSVYRVVNPGLVSNLGQGGSTEDDRSARRSQRFTTGAHLHGYEISGIQVGYVYDRGRSFDFSISLHAVDTDGDPGAKVADFTYPDGDNEDELTFETSDALTLDPGTTYAVVVSPGTAGTDIKLRATTSNDEDDESEDGWSIEDAFDIESGSSWAADTAGGSLKIRIRGTLKVGPPAKPTGLSANAMGRDRINLSWTAPSMDGGSAITGYRIESSADGATWTDLVADTGSTTTAYSHTGLPAGATRHYRVSAINVEGTSDASDTANATTDDFPDVTVQFGAATYTVAEGSTATVTVELSADPERTVAIPLTKTNQGGASSADYSGVPATVTFNSGDTEKTFTFTATADTVDDDDESVDLAFGTLPARVSAGSPSETTVSITDDDDPQVTVNFGAATYRAIEGSTAAVTVELSADPERTVEVPITKTNERGVSDSDYSGVPATVTFNSGDTEKTITFTATADSLNESGERVKLSFGTLPTRVSEGTPAETTVTISDSTQAQTTLPTIHFGGASYTVSEGGSVDVTVTLSKAPGSEAVIPLTASNQGGATASDYSGVPTSVTFGAAETSKTFTVTAAQDTVDDDGESILLGFGTLPGGITATTGQAAATTVSITDDDDPQVTVSFGAATYTAAEGSTATVTVTLSADPERTVAIPLTKTNQGGATSADYSGVPVTVTFDAGDTSKTFDFAATQDAEDDDGESVKLAFGTSLPVGVSAGSPSETTVSITDDDDPQVTVSFGAATYTAAEGGTATVTVTLSADPERTVAIPLTKTNQGGATSADYSGVPTSVTFGAAETSKTFTVTAAQDTVDDDGESILLGFGTLPGGITATTGQAAATTVSITDDDDPQVTVSFGASAYTAAEGGTATVTVTLSADPERTVEVRITTTNQGGATSADYSGVPASVTFDAGDTSKTFDFAATQDAEDDDGESVKLAFGALPTGVRAGATDETSVSISDDDDPAVTVSFGAATYTAAEGGTATVTVTLSADPERTVEVRITTTNQGGATSADYSGVPASVTFDAGDTSKTFDFAATQDAEDDDGESVDLGFGSSLPTGVSEGSPSETTVSITDDDDPAVTVSFGASTYTAAEGGTATVTVTLSADPERTVEVGITATNQGGATSADYSGVPASVTFDAGDTSKTFDFAATQDAEDDDGESVDLGFGSSLPTGVSEGSPSETTVSITDDDDPAVTVSFGASTYTAAEGGTATVTVTLSADPERTVEVGITATNQGGASAADYSGVPASVTFDAGDTSKTFDFAATQDAEDDDDESVDLGFGSSLPTGVSEGTTAETTVSIRDDDDPAVTVSFGASAYTAAEGGTATVTVTLSADPERTVEVRITTTNQGGASAADYSGVPASVTFDAGDTSKTFDFAATQDAEDDDDESVDLGFGSSLPTGVSEGTTAETTVSIRDDDDPAVTVSFGASAYTAAEGGTATVTVTLSADPERTVEVRITTTNQGGATSADYSGVPASVTFDAGDTSKTFDFAATQDAEDDDGESVLLGFGTLPGGITATTGEAAETTVSITDDDDPAVTVSFGAATYTAAEGGTATVTVDLSADPERTVTVPLTKTEQGGASSADYSGVPASVTFNAGETSQPITFAATQDAEDDDGESVKLAFGALPTGVSAGARDETTVSITDDDDPAVTVSFGAATYTAAEGSTATVTVNLSADPERTVAIPITKANQGGATSADYSGVPATVTFNSGDTSKTFDFTATADAVDDDGESVRLGFGTLPARVSAGSPKETTVSITDDDDPGVTVSFGAATYTAAEGSTATVTVTLSADPERTVAIPLTKTNQGGATSADYSGVPVTVTFDAGETSQPITFAATQDTEDDDGESVLLAFGALPTGVTAGATAETTVSITDDDDPGVTVTFGASTYTAAEGSTATVTVNLSADPERTVAIPITKANQGGATSADYSGVPATVTFNSGDTSKTFDFTATADAVDDDGESVRLGFGTLPARVSAGSPKETTVSITDDDDPGVTVSFGAATYTAAEGSTATVTVTLSADPERTVAIPITKTNQGGATSADYSGVPATVTFDAGDTSKTFDFAATADTEDDDGESVKLGFGSSLPVGVSEGSPGETTVSITDDDDPQVTVSFGASTYTAAEGGTATVTVSLSADPERTVTVPLTKTEPGRGPRLCRLLGGAGQRSRSTPAAEATRRRPSPSRQPRTPSRGTTTGRA